MLFGCPGTTLLPVQPADRSDAYRRLPWQGDDAASRPKMSPFQSLLRFWRWALESDAQAVDDRQPLFASREERGRAVELVADGVPDNARELKELLGLVPHADYARLSAEVYRAGRDAAPRLPAGWEVLVTAAGLGLDKEGYGAVAYVHHGSRNVVVAQRGTDSEEAVLADVYLMLLETPLHYELASEFSEAVGRTMDRRGLSAAAYTVSYTGHSLGAILAAREAFRRDCPAVTFDSPGALPLLQQLQQLEGTEGTEGTAAPAGQLEKWRRLYTTYLSTPNLANTLHRHVGNVFQVAPRGGDGEGVSLTRLSDLWGENKFHWRSPSTWVQATLAGNLPRTLDMIDVNLGAKLSYLLSHKDRHQMRGFLRVFADAPHAGAVDGALSAGGAPAPRSPPAAVEVLEVERWPHGPLECLKYDACERHLAPRSPQEKHGTGEAEARDSPLRRASIRTRDTVWRATPVDRQRLSVHQLPGGLLGLLHSSPRALVRSAARVGAVGPNGAAQMLALLTVLHGSVEDDAAGVVRLAGVDKTEFQVLAWRWRDELADLSRARAKL